MNELRWRFYGDLASDMFMREAEEFEYNKREYLESLGWNPEEYDPEKMELNYTADDVDTLRDLLKKNIEKYESEGMQFVDAEIEAMECNEVADFISNTIAEHLHECVTS
jgi:hypothetical protein